MFKQQAPMNNVTSKGSLSQQGLIPNLLGRNIDNPSSLSQPHLSTLPITYQTVVESSQSPFQEGKPQSHQNTPLTFNLHSPYKAKLKKGFRPTSRVAPGDEFKKNDQKQALFFDPSSRTICNLASHMGNLASHSANRTSNRSLKVDKVSQEWVANRKSSEIESTIPSGNSSQFEKHGVDSYQQRQSISTKENHPSIGESSLQYSNLLQENQFQKKTIDSLHHQIIKMKGEFGLRETPCPQVTLKKQESEPTVLQRKDLPSERETVQQLKKELEQKDKLNKYLQQQCNFYLEKMNISVEQQQRKDAEADRKSALWLEQIDSLRRGLEQSRREVLSRQADLQEHSGFVQELRTVIENQREKLKGQERDLENNRSETSVLLMKLEMLQNEKEKLARSSQDKALLVEKLKQNQEALQQQIDEKVELARSEEKRRMETQQHIIQEQSCELKEVRALWRELQKKNNFLEEKKNAEIKTMEEILKKESEGKLNQIRTDLESAISEKERVARQLEEAEKEFEKKLLLVEDAKQGVLKQLEGSRLLLERMSKRKDEKLEWIQKEKKELQSVLQAVQVENNRLLQEKERVETAHQREFQQKNQQQRQLQALSQLHLSKVANLEQQKSLLLQQNDALLAQKQRLQVLLDRMTSERIEQENIWKSEMEKLGDDFDARITLKQNLIQEHVKKHESQKQNQKQLESKVKTFEEEKVALANALQKQIRLKDQHLQTKSELQKLLWLSEEKVNQKKLQKQRLQGALKEADLQLSNLRQQNQMLQQQTQKIIQQKSIQEKLQADKNILSEQNKILAHQNKILEDELGRIHKQLQTEKQQNNSNREKIGLMEKKIQIQVFHQELVQQNATNANEGEKGAASSVEGDAECYEFIEVDRRGLEYIASILGFQLPQCNFVNSIVDRLEVAMGQMQQYEKYFHSYFQILQIFGIQGSCHEKLLQTISGLRQNFYQVVQRVKQIEDESDRLRSEKLHLLRECSSWKKNLNKLGLENARLRGIIEGLNDQITEITAKVYENRVKTKKALVWLAECQLPEPSSSTSEIFLTAKTIKSSEEESEN